VFYTYSSAPKFGTFLWATRYKPEEQFCEKFHQVDTKTILITLLTTKVTYFVIDVSTSRRTVVILLQAVLIGFKYCYKIHTGSAGSEARMCGALASKLAPFMIREVHTMTTSEAATTIDNCSVDKDMTSATK